MEPLYYRFHLLLKIYFTYNSKAEHTAFAVLGRVIKGKKGLEKKSDICKVIYTFIHTY